MENKTNVLATILGAIVVLVIFVAASFFIGQKLKEKFYKPKIVTTTVTDQSSPSLLTDKKTVATSSGKYKTIPSTGPESLGLILLPLIGTFGIYLKSKFAA